MKRRTALRNLVWIAAGASVLARCTSRDGKPRPTYSNLTLSDTEYQLITDLCASVLPAVSPAPGAAELQSQDFALTMINDCLSPEDQQRFMDGLRDFGKKFIDKYNHSFAEASSADRMAWIRQLDGNKTDAGDDSTGNSFYRTIKRYTIQSFTSSQYFLEQIAGWKLVPGPVFKGCVSA